MGPITNLLGAKVTCVGLGNAYARPLGYVIIWVQVDGVQGYDVDQIALVILDLSNFAAWIPVIWGTPTISWVVNVMKETEIDTLAMPWANARVAHLLMVCRMMTMKVGGNIAKESSPDSYDQVMFTQNIETIEAFSSCMVPVKVRRGYTGECINIMLQALWTEDGSLLQGPTVQNTYTELRQGSKKAVMVVRNSTAYLQTLWKKTPVARATVALPVPNHPWRFRFRRRVMSPRILIPPNWLSGKDMGNYSMNWIWVGWMLGPWGWSMPPASSWAEYHDVFSLDPAELGCTHSTGHMIKVTDDTPFKEQFRWIPPLLVEEILNHLQEMLELVLSGPARVPGVMLWCC